MITDLVYHFSVNWQIQESKVDFQEKGGFTWNLHCRFVTFHWISPLLKKKGSLVQVVFHSVVQSKQWTGDGVRQPEHRETVFLHKPAEMGRHGTVRRECHDFLLRGRQCRKLMVNNIMYATFLFCWFKLDFSFTICKVHIKSLKEISGQMREIKIYTETLLRRNRNATSSLNKCDMPKLRKLFRPLSLFFFSLWMAFMIYLYRAHEKVLKFLLHYVLFHSGTITDLYLLQLYTMTGETARKKLDNNQIGYISMNRRREFGMSGQDAFFKALKNLVEDYRYVLNNANWVFLNGKNCAPILLVAKFVAWS